MYEVSVGTTVSTVSGGANIVVVSRLRVLLLLLSVGLQVTNAPDILQPCGLLYYP